MARQWTQLSAVVQQAISNGLSDFMLNATPVSGGYLLWPVSEDGKVTYYFAQNIAGDEREVGSGIYTHATRTIQRTNIYQSTNNDAKVDFTAAPLVVATWGGELFRRVDEVLDITDGGTVADALVALGLENVDNVSDVDKPISSATQTALDGKEPLVSPKNTAFNKSFAGSGSTEGVARADHNHDITYAGINHNHDADYADITHNHDGDYEPAGAVVTHSGGQDGATAHVSAGDRAAWDAGDPDSHTHANKALLDTYTQTDVNIAAAVVHKDETGPHVTTPQKNEWDSKAEGTHTHVLTDVTDSGTAAALDSGTAIGNVVVLEDVGGNPGMPAVDGSQLTGIDGGSGGTAYNWLTANSGVDFTVAPSAPSAGAIALGEASAITDSEHSIAFGTSSVVNTALRGVAIGYTASVTASRAIAIGQAADASGAYSIAFGSGAVAQHSNAIAIGDSVSTGGNASVAIGSANTVAADSVAIGGAAHANSTQAISLGRGAVCDLAGGIAIGYAARAQTDTRIVVGEYSGEAGTAIVLRTINGALRVLTNGVVETSSDGGTNWDELSASYIGLTDTPVSYSGQQGKLVKVNATEDALIFGDPSGTTVSWGDISGTLSNQSDLQAELDAKQNIVDVRNWLDANNGANFATAPQAATANSIALGDAAQTSGTDPSVAIGFSAQAGSGGVAVGASSSVSSSDSVAVGPNATTTNSFCVSIGNTASASHTSTLAIGANTISSAPATIAIGAQAQATASEAVAVGQYARSKKAQAITIGNLAQIEAVDSISVLLRAGSVALRLNDDGSVETTTDYATWNPIGGGGGSSLHADLTDTATDGHPGTAITIAAGVQGNAVSIGSSGELVDAGTSPGAALVSDVALDPALYPDGTKWFYPDKGNEYVKYTDSDGDELWMQSAAGCGSGILPGDDNEVSPIRMSVVATLPGTPDANTLYFVTT